MRVVSNTSPVSNLAIIGRLDLLRRKYGRVVIPEAVRWELARLGHPEGRAWIEAALDEGWLAVEAVPDRRLLPLLRYRIDEGEAEAIELARQTAADLLLIDDLQGRKVAAEESLPYAGLLGVLAEEKLAGNLPSLKAEIDRLRSRMPLFRFRGGGAGNLAWRERSVRQRGGIWLKWRTPATLSLQKIGQEIIVGLCCLSPSTRVTPADR